MGESMVREPQHPIMEAKDVKPSHDWLKVDGVFNCGAVKYKGEYLLLCRVAESCREERQGGCRIPVYDEQNDQLQTVILDTTDTETYDFSDSRMIYGRTETGRAKIKYLTSISHLRLARSSDGIHFAVDERPTVGWSGRYERWGVEDPRIVYLEDEQTYCITYTAVSDLGAMPALLLTRDFECYERLGAVFPPENKDVVIFPKKINGMYQAFHRPVPSDIGTPDIWQADSPDLVHWGNHRHVCGVSEEGWENGRIGSGAPPICTPDGWLHIYHAADKDNRYCLGAMLTDLQEPGRLIRKSGMPIFEPEEDYETGGFFGGVVFTCGCILEDGELVIYYGAADDKICRARVPLTEVMDKLFA